MREIQALVLESGKPVLRTRSAPRAHHPDDVVVRVAATGICGTDRGIVLGEFPALEGVVLGHEAAGVVETVGSAVTRLRPGDRVVVNPTYHCGRCRPCRRGMAAHCTAKDGREIGVDRDGTMAGAVVVPKGFALPLPDSMSFRRAAVVEPLACVLTNVEAAAPRPDDRVLVIGGGPIGTLCALVFAHRGARTVLLERDTTRAALARDILPDGVEVVGSPGHGPGHGPGLALPAGVLPHGPDVVVDTTGVLLEQALEIVASGGTVVVMGEREHARASVPLRPLVTRGVRVIGAGPYPPHLFEAALDLAADLPIDRIVTHTFPLAAYRDAFAALAAPLEPATAPAAYAAMKVLLVSDPDLATR
ncbi:zinc-binding dehydrogenase [Streptomyces sp. 8ZJF_21]|uniref:zinc-dependent alcohol dehydrogenase n=1 Tax=Streptomyces sp. 8ZJF_21 TaxID=2903141 RepID=UPI001E314E68|nr:alcohol dehydrogenase catalytic domain-containing protein [Streptomyces sp. 8ZJF_21]MCD9589531.1 alcohol dehydrogenase catalytic domain-containing protein [Streptomyces sp. 8ZJF_21]